MEALGKASHGPGRIYLTGGSSAVLLNWRKMTVDVDLKLDPEPAGIFDALAGLKDELDINIELAAPDQFIPTLPGWRDRSLHIATCGELDLYHYDFCSQALAKTERFHARDKVDVAAMIERGLVRRDQLLKLFEEISSQLKRFPAVEPHIFGERVRAIAAGAT